MIRSNLDADDGSGHKKEDLQHDLMVREVTPWEARIKRGTFFVSALSLVSSIAAAVLVGSSYVGHLTGSSVPALASYVSPWVNGGSAPEQFCEPLRVHYANEYPSFDIRVQSFTANKKDLYGKVQYQYTCAYTAKRKS